MKAIKMKKFLILLLTLGFMLFCTAINAAEKRTPVKLEGKSVLPLRVLSKPFATIYQAKGATDQIVEENVPAFRSFYVYTRPEAADLELGDGWYEVGSDNRGGVVGWMKQDDVFEWKQALCLMYTHPLGRQPVLMFESRKFSRDLVEKTTEERVAAAEALYAKIEAGDINKDFPVVSVEPQKAVDITKEFYLLPILEYEDIEIENREGRLLKLAAVTNSGAAAREKSDIRTNKEYLTKANESKTQATAEKLQEMKVDVVWVIDTTSSMQGYIDKTLEVVKNISNNISSNEAAKNAVKFGVWGYRDAAEEIRGMEYTTQNYTQELKTVEEFIPELSRVKAVKVSSKGYEEDMFSGMADAISKTAWTEGAMRFIILVGDAPSHAVGHKWNASGQDENSLHGLAADRKIFVSAIHLKDPRAAKFHDLAETQMRTLATNPGMTEENYWPIDASDLDAFAAVSTQISGTISGSIASILNAAEAVATKTAAKATTGAAEAAKATTETATEVVEVAKAATETTTEVAEAVKAVEETATEAVEAAKTAAATAAGITEENSTAANATEEINDFLEETDEGEIELNLNSIVSQASGEEEDINAMMVKAAMVQWLGSQTGAQAPRDVTAWVIDKDFIDPAISSLEVRLLLTKRQLDTLYQVLTSVLAAGQQGQIGGEDFFDALQATAATAARDPELLKTATNMASARLVPEFLEGLPYHSQLMDMSNELWNSWSVDEQNDFLNNLEAIIEAYKTIHDSPEGWVLLNPGDDADMAVYPLALELLP